MKGVRWKRWPVVEMTDFELIERAVRYRVLVQGSEYGRYWIAEHEK